MISFALENIYIVLCPPVSIYIIVFELSEEMNFFGLFLIYYNHKKLETHISRANEDTSKLEPPNVIAFKRQQAHLAHKEAFLMKNKSQGEK